MAIDLNDKLAPAREHSAKGLIMYYNMISATRNYDFPAHLTAAAYALADTRILNLMLLIGPGCLSGDTVIGWERSPQSGLRHKTLKELYHKFNGISWPSNSKSNKISRPWDRRIPTKTLSYTGDRLAMNNILSIQETGIKSIYRVQTWDDRIIKVSNDHPFLVHRDNKFAPLRDLRSGDVVLTRETNASKGGRKPAPKRHVIHSIPFHPYGQRHFIYNKNYKRLPAARLLLEAHLNNLTLDELVMILRTDEDRASSLKYIPPEFEVHHKDENPLNDIISNLEIVTFKQHLAIHAYEKQKNFGNILTRESQIKWITHVGEEMTYDITMTPPNHSYVANNFVVHNSGKSYLLTEIYTSWEIGHDPTKTIMGVSAGENLIQGFLRSVMEIIEWSPVWRALFPRVRPDKAAGWSSERGLFVTGRDIGNSDANYAAFGLDSKVLTGKHAKILVFDDLHDKENSATEEQCDKVWATYNNTLLGRADPGGARFIVAGRRWSKNDVYQKLIDSGEFVVLVLPAEREKTNRLWVDVMVPDGLTCCFNE